MKVDCLAEICYKPLGDKGEDAFAYNIRHDAAQAIAVFDGCGGAGAWKYPEFNHYTGAFVSAQSISGSFLTWFESLAPSDLRNPEALSQSFLERSQRELLRLKQACAPMGVSGSLVKSFPCTASIAVISQASDQKIGLTTLNTGDSRVYFLTPENGLVQVTKDDSRGNPDPLDSLRENPPLSNVLNADKPYKVNTCQIVLPVPCAVVCATDGVFGFVRSPMDFEFMMLKCILESGTVHEFEQRFQEEIVRLTGDDSTCLAAFYGWGSYVNIRKSLTPRFHAVQEIIKDIEGTASPEEREQIIRYHWEKYKKSTVYYEMQG